MNRRTALITTAAASFMPVSVFAAQDPHIEWLRLSQNLDAKANTLRAEIADDYDADFEETVINPIRDEQWDFEDKILLTPADTLDGVRVQLRVMARDMERGGLIEGVGPTVARMVEVLEAMHA